MASPRHTGRNLGILALVLVLLSAVVVGYRLTRPDTRSATDLSIGYGVKVTGTKVPVKIKVQPVADKTPLNYTPFGAQAETVSITPSGKLSAPVTLKFPLKGAVPKDAGIVIATKEDQNWSYLTPAISNEGGHWYASVQTDRLSKWSPLSSVSILPGATLQDKFVQDLKDTITSDLTEKAEKPTCKDESKARDDDYQLSYYLANNGKDKNTIYWCFGVEDGKRVVKIVNRKHYPLDVSYSGLTVKSAGLPTAELHQLSKLIISKDHLVLFPTETAVFTVSLKKGDTARINTTYGTAAGQATALEGLEAVIDTYASVLGKIGAPVKALSEAKKVKAVDVALQSRDCWNAVVNTNLPALFLNCAKALDETVGPQALILSVVQSVGSLTHFFVSGIQGNIDNFSKESRYTIKIERFSGKPVTFHGLTIYVPESWRVKHGDGVEHPDEIGFSVGCSPQTFWDTPCTSFWLIGPRELSHYGDGTQTYTSNEPYYPATDIRPCRGESTLNPSYWRGPQTTRTSSSRPIGSHTALYHEWRYQCGKLTSSGAGPFQHIPSRDFTQQAWSLPQSRILVVTEWDVPGLNQILESAQWN